MVKSTEVPFCLLPADANDLHLCYICGSNTAASDKYLESPNGTRVYVHAYCFMEAGLIPIDNTHR